MSKTISFIFLATLLLLGCSKNDEPPKAPVDQLPAATQVGANKVGCLVNGEVFLPQGSNPLGPPIVTCFYQFVNNAWYFSLGYSNNQQDRLRNLRIVSKAVVIQLNQTYPLILQNDGNFSASYSKFAVFEYNTTNDIKGELKITKLDQTNAIISGTFWFDAANNAGEIVKITEGRFDMKYSQ